MVLGRKLYSSSSKCALPHRQSARRRGVGTGCAGGLSISQPRRGFESLGWAAGRQAGRAKLAMGNELCRRNCNCNCNSGIWHLASEASAGGCFSSYWPPCQTAVARRDSTWPSARAANQRAHTASPAAARCGALVQQRACQLIPASPQHNTHEASALVACLWPRPLPATACPSSTTAVCARCRPRAAVLPCCQT
jgi:hypothetical protein